MSTPIVTIDDDDDPYHQSAQPLPVNQDTKRNPIIVIDSDDEITVINAFNKPAQVQQNVPLICLDSDDDNFINRISPDAFNHQNSSFPSSGRDSTELSQVETIPSKPTQSNANSVLDSVPCPTCLQSLPSSDIVQHSSDCMGTKYNTERKVKSAIIQPASNSDDDDFLPTAPVSRQTNSPSPTIKARPSRLKRRLKQMRNDDLTTEQCNESVANYYKRRKNDVERLRQKGNDLKDSQNRIQSLSGFGKDNTTTSLNLSSPHHQLDSLSFAKDSPYSLTGPKPRLISKSHLESDYSQCPYCNQFFPKLFMNSHTSGCHKSKDDQTVDKDIGTKNYASTFKSMFDLNAEKRNIINDDDAEYEGKVNSLRESNGLSKANDRDITIGDSKSGRKDRSNNENSYPQPYDEFYQDDYGDASMDDIQDYEDDLSQEDDSRLELVEDDLEFNLDDFTPDELDQVPTDFSSLGDLTSRDSTMAKYYQQFNDGSNPTTSRSTTSSSRSRGQSSTEGTGRGRGRGRRRGRGSSSKTLWKQAGGNRKRYYALKKQQEVRSNNSSISTSTSTSRSRRSTTNSRTTSSFREDMEDEPNDFECDGSSRNLRSSSQVQRGRGGIKPMTSKTNSRSENSSTNSKTLPKHNTTKKPVLDLYNADPGLDDNFVDDGWGWEGKGWSTFK
ncbi:hypothetical protein BKA69DRAFT_1088859 [Paraphysoderma sedebokerense]|nr:hypothetical protein BKA69DRAFT_1088859 [Paraphysoderma sedebokerense]